MNKYTLLVRIGFLLMALGVILNRVIDDFPFWAVGVMHLSAIACFVIYFMEYRKNKK